MMRAWNLLAGALVRTANVNQRAALIDESFASFGLIVGRLIPGLLILFGV